MSESLTGQKLGPYRVGALLGEGAMGEVYRGVHEELGRRVAIKTLKRSLGVDAELMARIFAEAKAVNIICHENIVECTDLVHDPTGRSYIVMELLEGRTLGAAIKAGRMAPVDAVRIAAQIADAIGAAHDKGIVHRDLKPDNVFLIDRAGQSDYVKVLDFGIARLTGLTATEAGALIGTPAYMSPEQAAGERAVPASDLYALGVILFQLVTGRLPLPGDTLPEMLAAHISKQPPRADAFAAMPAALADAIDRALAKTAAARPESMHAFRAMILRAVDLPVRPSKRPTPLPLELEATRPPEIAPAARPVGNTSLSAASGEASLPRAPRRRWWPYALAGAAAIGLGAFALWPRGEPAVVAPVGFDDVVAAGCAKADGALSCEVELSPGDPADPEARPWIAHVNLTPRAGATLADERGCARVESVPIANGKPATRLVVTDCLLQYRVAHGYRMRLGATKDGVTHHADVRLAVATPAAQHAQGYKTLLSNRSYALADVWFLDAEKRAETVLETKPTDPDAPQILTRAIYYRAFTRYMRLIDCAMRHRVEGKACTADDMRRWYTEAIEIIENPLALALKRPSIPEKQVVRQQNDRARLENEIVLRFSLGKVGAGSSVQRRLQSTTTQCTDFVQQSHAFLALIAASTGRGAEAIEHLKAILANLTALPARCAKDDAERDSLARSANAVLLAEYGVCGGQPVLKDVTAFVCAVRREFPQLPADAVIAKACTDAPDDRDDDLNRAVRLLAINLRRRNEGLPWRGGCHQKRLASRAAEVAGTAMAGEPNAVMVQVAAADAKDASYHFVIDADGKVHERRPLALQATHGGACARSIGIAVDPTSPLAAQLGEELVDELRARYAIPQARVNRCD